MADTVHQSASLGIAARAKAIENPNPDPLFDTAQAAVYLHSSEPSLERFRRIGVGPKFVKMGGAVRYRRSDLELLHRAMHAPAAPPHGQARGRLINDRDGEVWTRRLARGPNVAPAQAHRSCSH